MENKKRGGKKSLVWFDMSSLPPCLGCGISAQSLALLTKNDGQQVFGAVWWHRVDTIPPTPPAWEEVKTILPTAGKNTMFEFQVFVDLLLHLLLLKEESLGPLWGFFLFYIFIYIYTHTNTHQNILTITCVQDWSGGSQTSCLYLLAYLFAAGGRREIKLPKKEAEKEPSEWPPPKHSFIWKAEKLKAQGEVCF